METQEKLKKINAGYLLLNIFGPILLLGVAFALVMVLPEPVDYVVCLAAFFFAVLWWSFLSRKTYDNQKKKKLAELDAQGFVRNQTFNADGCTVALDIAAGRLAVLFRWNPGKVYVVPAKRVSRVWVDDGKGGAGFLTGSSRVSFLFTVDGMTIRVNTFVSNKRWRMDSDYILTGISKADMMVEALTAAGAGTN